MRVTTTKDQSVNYIRALVYGDSGTGKTTSLGTLPEASTLIIAAERGLLPLQGRGYNVIQVDNWEDLRGVVRALVAGDSKDNALSIDIDGVKIKGIRTVAFDSLTIAQKLLRDQVINIDRVSLIQQRMSKEEIKEQEQSGITKTSPVGVYRDQVTQEDHGVIGGRLEKFLLALSQLQCNTVITALSGWEKDEVTAKTHRVLGLTGYMKTAAVSQFDIVLHMESDENGKRLWRTFNDGIHLSKDSSGTLDDFEQCNWTELFKKIRKGKKRTAQEDK